MLEPPLCEGEPGRVNSFALVSYIPGQLGRFLDELRQKVEPNTLAPRAHITLLPPRCLGEHVTAESAAAHLDRVLVDVPAVEIYLGSMEIFPITNVVYLSVDGGFMQLRKMHERLNSGPLGCIEPFHYHPHVTLAQGLTLPEAERVRDQATDLWRNYRGPRGFATDAFSFVQANAAKRWIDLAEYAMAPAAR